MTPDAIVTTLIPVPPDSATAPDHAGDRPARVWDFHPRVEHYRIALWDEITRLGRGTYKFTVCGPLTDGGAFGGGQRPYFREFPTDTFKRFGISMLQWRDAERIVAAEQPDVVIVSANPRNMSNWKLPGVVHRYGGAAVCWTKAHSYSRLPGPIVNTIKKRFYKRFDRAICYGRQSLAELTALGFPADRARVAQNTIDTRRIFEDGDAIAARGRELRAEAGLADATILLSIGRMDPEKRHQDLLDAWPKLRELDDKSAMVLVSGGPLLEDIRRQADQLDPQRIIVTGRVPEGDDYCWIAASDVCIYPGAVGLAINQSLALGRPTIIADEYGADSEILMHDRTGWRYPRGDIDALVDTVRQVLNDDPARARITAAAVEMMRDEVTVESQARSIDQTIREALTLTRAAGRRKERT